MNEHITLGPGGWAEVEIHKVTGICPVRAQVIGRRFAVHRRNADPDAYLWSVTHLRSGWRMPWSFNTPRQAQRFASSLSVLCDRRDIDLDTPDVFKVVSRLGSHREIHREIYALAADYSGTKESQ